MRNIRRAASAAREVALWVRDERAVTALEYGIVAAFLCLSLLGIFSRFGSAVSAMFAATSNGL